MASSPRCVLPATTTGAWPRWSRRRHSSLGAGVARRRLHLEVAGDEDPLGRRAEADDPAGVLLGLHAEEGDVRQHPAEEAADEAVAAVGAVGDPAVGEDRGHLRLAKRPQEIGPQLRLERDEAAGLHPAHGPPDGSAKVEREREHRRGLRPAAPAPRAPRWPSRSRRRCRPLGQRRGAPGPAARPPSPPPPTPRAPRSARRARAAAGRGRSRNARGAPPDSRRPRPCARGTAAGSRAPGAPGRRYRAGTSPPPAARVRRGGEVARSAASSSRRLASMTSRSASRGTAMGSPNTTAARAKGCGTTKASHDRRTRHGDAPKASGTIGTPGHLGQHDGAVLRDVARPPRPVGHDQDVVARPRGSPGPASGARGRRRGTRSRAPPGSRSPARTGSGSRRPGSGSSARGSGGAARRRAAGGGSARATRCRSRASPLAPDRLDAPRAGTPAGGGSRRARAPSPVPGRPPAREVASARPGRRRSRAAGARRRAQRPAAPSRSRENGAGGAESRAGLAEPAPDLEQGRPLGRPGHVVLEQLERGRRDRVRRGLPLDRARARPRAPPRCSEG